MVIFQGKTYLSDWPNILGKQSRNEDHTTLRNSPVVEVLGQWGQHLS